MIKSKSGKNAFCTLFGGVFFALWSVHAYMESSIAWRTYFEYIRRRSAVLDHFNLCNLSQLRDKEWSLGLVPLSLSVCLPACSGATNHWKNAAFRDFPTFSRTWIFFLRRLSLFDFLSYSLLFSDSSHLCFSSVHIVGSLTSKLPSTIFFLLRASRKNVKTSNE